MRPTSWWMGFLCLFAASLAHAQLSIEITGAGGTRTPIAIAPLAGEGALGPTAISAIVRADLERSGQFRALELPPLNPTPTEASTVNYSEWRARLADALVVGSVSSRPDGRFEVRFRLHDTVKQAALGGIAYTMTKDQVRATAHRIADFVYEKLTGDKGVFSTRIAYVVKRGNRYELQIADADGDGRGDRARLVRADHLARLVARRPAPRLRVVREQEAGGLRPLAARRQAPGGRPTSGARTPPRPGRRTARPSP